MGGEGCGVWWGWGGMRVGGGEGWRKGERMALSVVRVQMLYNTFFCSGTNSVGAFSCERHQSNTIRVAY